ncbi:unnamed protein product [Peniophora sp. CBMAI 1063]|nr:unnamed protein product [Peniophora sp. CBMAI 1063]
MLCRLKLAGATRPVLHGIGRRQVDVPARARSCLHWTFVQALSGSFFLPSAARQYRIDPRTLVPLDADITLSDIIEVPRRPDHTHRTTMVIIGPLGPHMDDARLEAAWSALGTIVDAQVNEDVTGGELLRYGIVKYRSAKSVDAALLLDGRFLGGRRVYVRALFRHLDTVFVTGLDWDTEEAELRSAFEPCGEIIGIRLRTVRSRDRTARINAIIKFAYPLAAELALRRSGMLLDGKPIKVVLYLPRSRTMLYHAIRGGEPPSDSIRVSNLPPQANDDWLRSTFEPCGEVTGTIVQKLSPAAGSLGFAYVTFKSPDAVDRAVQLDGEVALDGHIINIERASPYVPFSRNAVVDNTSRASNVISVHGLPEDVDDVQLRSACERFGEVVECSIHAARATHGLHGYGFVTFASPHSATEALNHGRMTVDGLSVRIRTAFPRLPWQREARVLQHRPDPSTTYLAQIQYIIRRI